MAEKNMLEIFSREFMKSSNPSISIRNNLDQIPELKDQFHQLVKDWK